MTTIVYDHKNKQVAVEMLVVVDGIICSTEFDKTLTNDNGTYFLCGDCCDYEKLSKLSHDDKLEVTPNCSAILIKDRKAYAVIVQDSLCCFTELKYNYAMGSGERFALSALDYGATAKEAVEYAITKDIFSGGAVIVKSVLGKSIEQSM